MALAFDFLALTTFSSFHGGDRQWARHLLYSNRQYSRAWFRQCFPHVPLRDLMCSSRWNTCIPDVTLFMRCLPLCVCPTFVLGYTQRIHFFLMLNTLKKKKRAGRRGKKPCLFLLSKKKVSFSQLILYSYVTEIGYWLSRPEKLKFFESGVLNLRPSSTYIHCVTLDKPTNLSMPQFPYL